MDKALIVEDTLEARHWMAEALGEVCPDCAVDMAASFEEAQNLAARRNYYLALIDLHLPDGNGTDLIAAINSRSPGTLTVVVTIYDDDQHLFPALQAGAGGYLLKDMPAQQFIRRLKSITRGEPPLSPSIARRLLGYFKAPEPVTAHDLSPREREVLTLIARGLKLSEVAEELNISSYTAGDYVKSIYRKLNISSRAEATLAASRMGFIQPR